MYSRSSTTMLRCDVRTDLSSSLHPIAQIESRPLDAGLLVVRRDRSATRFSRITLADQDPLAASLSLADIKQLNNSLTGRRKHVDLCLDPSLPLGAAVANADGAVYSCSHEEGVPQLRYGSLRRTVFGQLTVRKAGSCCGRRPHRPRRSLRQGCIRQTQHIPLCRFCAGLPVAGRPGGRRREPKRSRLIVRSASIESSHQALPCGRLETSPRHPRLAKVQKMFNKPLHPYDGVDPVAGRADAESSPPDLGALPSGSAAGTERDPQRGQ
jgi:hypothetical protein